MGNQIKLNRCFGSIQPTHIAKLRLDWIAMTCPHLESLSFQPPRYNQAVHREECTQCFDNQDHPDGVDVCLTCFNGGCPRLHAQAHSEKLPGHPIALNITRTRKLKQPMSPTSAKRVRGRY